MFDICVDRNNRKVELQIENIDATTRKAIRKAFYFIGKDLVKTSRKLIMDPPKTGRIYRLRKGGKIVRHQASAPGQPPANFTGSLRDSLDFDVIGSDKMEFGVKQLFQNRRGTPLGVNYGKYLEGDPNRKPVKLFPRPFLLPSIKSNQKNTQVHFETQLKKELEELA
jgi:hypothetical protein